MGLESFISLLHIQYMISHKECIYDLVLFLLNSTFTFNNGLLWNNWLGYYWLLYYWLLIYCWLLINHWLLDNWLSNYWLSDWLCIVLRNVSWTLQLNWGLICSWGRKCSIPLWLLRSWGCCLPRLLRSWNIRHLLYYFIFIHLTQKYLLLPVVYFIHILDSLYCFTVCTLGSNLSSIWIIIY